MAQSYKIMSIEAKDLFGAMHQVGKEDCEYGIRSPDGTISLKRFSNAFDWSLDAIKLEDVYCKKTRRHDFVFKVGKYLYTKNVVCVTFNYAYKEFNMAGKNTYVRNGYNYRDCTFIDGVDIRDGRLIAIQTNVEVQNPVESGILCGFFEYADGFYRQSGTIPTIMDKAELRNYLYQNGFKCDGVEYVRYKRSSGSSRVGKCLFVNKILADEMHQWDMCGLHVEDGQPIDLASWEAYIALPISSIIDTIHIPLDSILVVDDYESTFTEDVVAVEIEDNHLVSSHKPVKITNNIWDGQSLMDKSLFGAYESKGMLLLRNRFFKSCCFNTNMFGQNILPFTESMAYQVVSLIAVVVVAGINAWYNNDISKIALLCGGVFDALSDGKITEEEIEKILADAEDAEKIEEVKKDNFIVNFFNSLIKSTKDKIQKE